MYVARTAPVSVSFTVPLPTAGTAATDGLSAALIDASAVPVMSEQRVVLGLTAPLVDPGGSGISVTAPSQAEGPWEVDWERARKDALTVLNAIDFSQRDIFLWCSGTGGTKLDAPVASAIAQAWSGKGVTATALQYPSNWNLRSSVPTGIATLKLVLDEIARRGGNHRVMLSGVSQGAWIIGEVMADTTMRSVVHRAVIMGHPFLAKSQYVDGKDPKVDVVNHKGDIVTMPIHGYTGALDAIEAVLGTKRNKLAAIPQAALGNLHLLGPALRIGLFLLPGIGPLVGNPHEYGHEMPQIVRRLKDGTALTGADRVLPAAA